MAIDHDRAIRELLNRRGRLLTAIYLHTRDTHAAEDIYQDVLLKLMKSGEPFANGDAVYAWAKVVARNAAIDLIRRKGRQAASIQADVLDLLESQLDAADLPDHADEVDALRHCLAALSPESRRIIELRYKQGLSGLDLAHTLGRPVKSVYVTVSRIYRKLADCIAARTAGPEGVARG